MISLIIFISKFMIDRTSKPNPPDKPFNPNLYDDKCVSEICQCGRHRCPPPDFTKAARFQQPILPNDAFTKCKCNCRKAKKKCCCKCKHKGKGHQNVWQQRHYDPSAIQTTYQVNFQGKYVQQDPLRRTNGHGSQGIINHGSKAPFIGNTEYNTQYIGKIVQKDLVTRTALTLQPQSRPPFDGTTTYNSSYQGRIVQRQNPINPTKAIERPHVPFDGTTQYNSKYQYIAVEDCGGQCESCCDCASEQCEGCCDCQSVDSLDRVNTNIKQNPSTYYQTHVVPPQAVQSQVMYPQLETALQKGQQQNTDCPVKKLPPVPKKCEPGKTHTKFVAKKNIWK